MKNRNKDIYVGERDVRGGDGTTGRQYLNSVINSHVVECVNQNPHTNLQDFPLTTFVFYPRGGAVG
jgi:hypothetical protein